MREVDALSRSTARGRWVLVTTVLGSAMASLDATAVNIALPAIGRDLGGGVAELQWTVNGYSLTLAAFLLLGGALGDRFGRRRIFVVGAAWFTVASVACGLAPTAGALIAARLFQGVGAALLMPGSLAILEASFRSDERGSVIGTWSALGGLATAIGPFVGGWLVQVASWRWVFFLNLPLAFVTIAIARRYVPETRDPSAPPRTDYGGAALAVVGLGGLTWTLIEAPGRTLGSPWVLAAGAVALLALALFFVVERRRTAPMLDLGLFRSTTFSITNVETLLVYAALSGTLFLLPIVLQQRLGYSPVRAGAALLPTTLLMLLLSSRAGRLAQRIGPRLPMTIGPLLMAVAFLLFSRASEDYVATVLPASTVLGLGLASTVAPLTATVLAAAPTEKAGVASAINNCIARTGGLLAVAVVPTLTGAGAAQTIDLRAFERGLIFSAGLCLLGAAVAFVGIPRAAKVRRSLMQCPLDAPLLRSPPHITRAST